MTHFARPGFLSLMATLLCGLLSAQQVYRVPAIPWVKEPGIRLNLGAGDPPGTLGLQRPHVLRFPDRTWRMYYGTSAGIASARSFDGISWTKEAGTRITPASIGVGGVAMPVVVRASPTLFRMYFRTHFPFRVWSAISTNGLTWTPEGVRIADDVADFGVVERPSGGFRAYYIVSATPQSGPLPVVSAVSADGLIWTPEAGTRHPGARVLTASRLDDESVILSYSVDFFSTQTARSNDGLTFIDDVGTRMVPGDHPDSNPHESTTILVSSLVQFPDGKVRAYYQGSSTGDVNNPARIFSAVVGLRQAADPLGLLPTSSWTKEGTRLDLDGFEPVGTTALHMPDVVRFPDGTMRMYYTAWPLGMVMSAVSADGIKWTKEPGFRLTATQVGAPNLWGPCVVRTNSGLYRMYCGDNNVYSATSTDGLNFTAEGGVRLTQAHFPKVLSLAGSALRMYFWEPNSVNIASATSTDGINWSRDAGVRLTNATSFAVATLNSDETVLCFSSPSQTFVGTARSSNGLHFTVDAGSRLALDGLPDSTALVSSLVQFYDGTVRLYYQGSPSATDANSAGYVRSAIAGFGNLTMDRGVITSLEGGTRRYCLRGQANKEFVVRGSMSGLSNRPPGACKETLIEDDYYRTTSFNGDPLMSGSYGWFGPSGIEEGVYRVPPGFFPTGQGIWHALHVLSCPPPIFLPVNGRVVAGGGLAANGSSPIRLTVK